jgi:hypothetical protein
MAMILGIPVPESANMVIIGCYKKGWDVFYAVKTRW